MTYDLAPLYALLDEFDLPYDPETPTSGLVVHDSLDIRDTGITTLPPNTVIQGTLVVSRMESIQLPRGLVITGTLLADGSHLRSLPEDISIGNDVSLERSLIAKLPDHFRVQGELNLMNTPIETLPEGLHVGERLCLLGTPIDRLPKSLNVGGLILPPPELSDFRAFAATLSGPVNLFLTGSQHQRMDLQERLRPFPDVLRIVLSLNEKHQLRFNNDPKYGYVPEVALR